MAAPLTIQQARDIHLAAQGLAGAKPAVATPGDVLAAIRRMAALQIDTINVVARSPYLVLWSRIGDYEQAWLDDLLAGGQVFEYWAHAACFIPAEQHPAYRRRMLDGTSRLLQQVRKGLATRQEMADAMLARIAEGGPVRSSDFERTEGQKGGGWWDWKDEKLVLELLFSAGELMVARRRNFQRVYDLRERVRPGADENLPTLDEANRALARESVRAMGIARRAWVPGYLFHYELRTVALKATAELVKDGELLEVEVEGWPEPGVVHPDNSALLEAVREAGYEHSRTEVLSPFDPVTWDRARAFELFGFDYKIECYTPAPKRVYGYFTLPILHDGQLVGRLDPKAHRKLGVFEVKSVHLEPWVSVTHELVTELKDTLRRCAKWHGTPELVVRAANGPGLAEALGRG